MITHQYIDRRTQQPRDETLYRDSLVCALYSIAAERAAWLTTIASSKWFSNTLARLNYGNLLGSPANYLAHFIRSSGIKPNECVERLETLNTAQKLFERQIRFWECRPMPREPATVVCPCDSRVVIGSLNETSSILIKDKFFDCDELLSVDRYNWREVFAGGEFAIFRLTPEKYHYVHVPAAGVVEDFYEIPGRYHSCNPGATVSLITPHSKNRRVITILQTDVVAGAWIGLVAIIEVVALMVGQIAQCYSDEKYHSPRPVARGMFLRKGQPKSLFRPGSSTVILLFQPGRIRFAEDLVSNRFRYDVQSRFSLGLNQPIVETDVAVRSSLASRMDHAKGNLA